MKTLAPILIAAFSLVGCAKLGDYGTRLIASSASALAVVNGNLLTGKVTLNVDRSGTVALQGANGLNCMGNLRYTATPSGAINLQCSDGTQASLAFYVLSETSGYAHGRSATAPASLTFGLDTEEATAYLIVPNGKRLVRGEGVLRLQ